MYNVNIVSHVRYLDLENGGLGVYNQPGISAMISENVTGQANPPKGGGYFRTSSEDGHVTIYTISSYGNRQDSMLFVDVFLPY